LIFSPPGGLSSGSGSFGTESLLAAEFTTKASAESVARTT
jgi:hypothetical protein